MKEIFIFLFAFGILSYSISCKKGNSSTGQNAITRNWKFISENANTQSTVQYSDGGVAYKTITTSKYTTINNNGTVSITSTVMNGTALAYAINDSPTVYDYEDGTLIDSFSTPFSYIADPVNSTTNYTLVGTDSIYFSGGGFISSAGLSGPTPGTNRAKIIINGNTMTLTSDISKDTTINDSGILETHNDKATLITTLQKQ